LIPAGVGADISPVVGPKSPEGGGSQAKLLRIIRISLGANPLLGKKQ
jgi:hypothetical protein